jgi:ubiquinone/menaquinone biosynthesis C-methylase UbiE
MTVCTKGARRLPVRAGYDLWSESYDHTDNPVVAIDNLHAMPLLQPQSGERILDAGCGTGRHLEPLLRSGACATGLDFSAGMLAVARRKLPAACLVQADLQTPLPFHDAAFDAILCALIGEHLPRLCETFREFRRLLAPEAACCSPCITRRLPKPARKPTSSARASNTGWAPCGSPSSTTWTCFAPRASPGRKSTNSPATPESLPPSRAAR